MFIPRGHAPRDDSQPIALTLPVSRSISNMAMLLCPRFVLSRNSPFGWMQISAAVLAPVDPSGSVDGLQPGECASHRITGEGGNGRGQFAEDVREPPALMKSDVTRSRA